MSVSRDYYETADYTARALGAKGAVKNITSSNPPISDSSTWLVSFETVEGRWKLNGDASYVVIVDPDGGVDAQPYDLCSRGVFAVNIVQSVTGRSVIAPHSRYEMKRANENGEKDARARFRRGMRALTDNPSKISTWRDLDSNQVWEAIEYLAGEQYPHTLRAAHVPLVIFDVYDDAYYQTAVDLVATIR